MLHILLTTIISYVTNIDNVNKQYHNTFLYRYCNSLGYDVLYTSNNTMYNWRYRDMCDGGSIYNKFCDKTEYRLPPNY